MEKITEPGLKPLPRIKVTEQTPTKVRKALADTLKEVEETFKRTKVLASLHRSAIEEARKGEEYFNKADRKEEIAKEFSRSIKNLLKKRI